MAFMVVRGSVWPRMEFWTGQGGKPGSQRRQKMSHHRAHLLG